MALLRVSTLSLCFTRSAQHTLSPLASSLSSSSLSSLSSLSSSLFCMHNHTYLMDRSCRRLRLLSSALSLFRHERSRTRLTRRTRAHSHVTLFLPSNASMTAYSKRSFTSTTTIPKTTTTVWDDTPFSSASSNEAKEIWSTNDNTYNPFNSYTSDWGYMRWKPGNERRKPRKTHNWPRARILNNTYINAVDDIAYASTYLHPHTDNVDDTSMKERASTTEKHEQIPKMKERSRTYTRTQHTRYRYTGASEDQEQRPPESCHETCSCAWMEYGCACSWCVCVYV